MVLYCVGNPAVIRLYPMMVRDNVMEDILGLNALHPETDCSPWVSSAFNTFFLLCLCRNHAISLTFWVIVGSSLNSQSSSAPLTNEVKAGPLPYTLHSCMGWPWTGFSKSLLLEVWSAWIFGGSVGPNDWRWYTTSVVACVVWLPSRVSSLKSLLSATNSTNGPGVMFDGMTALVWAVPHSVLQSHDFLRPC